MRTKTSSTKSDESCAAQTGFGAAEEAELLLSKQNAACKLCGLCFATPWHASQGTAC